MYLVVTAANSTKGFVFNKLCVNFVTHTKITLVFRKPQFQ